MVGEIRDVETAQIAVQASLTGHLVLSTLHTNSAIGAVTRLRDMGIEPFLLASSLIGLVAQRLIRVLCTQCKAPYQPTAQELALLGGKTGAAARLYQAVGCEACHQLGFNGRSGIYELISVDNALQQLIHDNAAEHQLEAYAFARTSTMRQDGFARVLQGMTTIDEVLRVTAED
jgi:general secretion pathway protein E